MQEYKVQALGIETELLDPHNTALSLQTLEKPLSWLEMELIG